MILWTRWYGLMDASHIARIIGVTEVDIKRFRYAYSHYMIEVETWNRRKIRVSGMEMEMHRRFSALLTDFRVKELVRRQTLSDALNSAPQVRTGWMTGTTG